MNQMMRQLRFGEICRAALAIKDLVLHVPAQSFAKRFSFKDLWKLARFYFPQ